MSWYLDTDNRLNHADLAAEIPGDIFTWEYPASFWRVSNNKLTLNSNDWQALPNEIEGGTLTPPYPASFWYYDEEEARLNNALLPDEPGGSFTGCSSLAYVSIPESVKLIGYRAFAGTAITKVRIARDCVYDETSFPAGCEIWYYDEEPEVVDYGALISDLTARVAALENNQ